MVTEVANKIKDGEGGPGGGAPNKIHVVKLYSTDSGHTLLHCVLQSLQKRRQDRSQVLDKKVRNWRQGKREDKRKQEGERRQEKKTGLCSPLPTGINNRLQHCSNTVWHLKPWWPACQCICTIHWRRGGGEEEAVDRTMEHAHLYPYMLRRRSLSCLRGHTNFQRLLAYGRSSSFDVKLIISQ